MSGSDLMKNYQINIFHSEEDGGYIDLDACSAFGTSASEALVEVEIAKEAWLDAAWSEDRSVPRPQYIPR